MDQTGSTIETRCNEHARHISLQHFIKSETAAQKPQNKFGENDYTGRTNMARVMETIKATVLANLNTSSGNREIPRIL